MEKNDLRSGMYVRNREGTLFLVIKDYVSCLDSKEDFLFIKHDLWDCGCNYSDDLKNIYFRSLDIVEVLIPKKQNIFHIFHLLNDEELIQIWKYPTNPHEEEFYKTGYTVLKDDNRNVKIEVISEGKKIQVNYFDGYSCEKSLAMNKFDIDFLNKELKTFKLNN